MPADAQTDVATEYLQRAPHNGRMVARKDNISSEEVAQATKKSFKRLFLLQIK